LALLRKAFEQALNHVDQFHWDKYFYRELCSVGTTLMERGENPAFLDEAIALMRQATDELLDPTMSRELTEFEMMRAKFG
jgi:hypothetical protein